MATAATTQREWIASEFSKGIEAEQSMIDEAKVRVQAPPDPSLQVLYSEIASADERHLHVVTTIATRYGYTPKHSMTGGIGETLGRLKDKMGEIRMTGLQKVAADLAEKANAIHWTAAWVAAFEKIGDVESARDLSAVLVEEKTHRDALQEGMNRLVTQGAMGELAAS